VLSVKLPSVSRNTPPSKFQTVLGMRFGLSPGFWPANADAIGWQQSSNAAISTARENWGQRVHIQVVERKVYRLA
jgi:hypothetical protein